MRERKRSEKLLVSGITRAQMEKSERERERRQSCGARPTRAAIDDRVALLLLLQVVRFIVRGEREREREKEERNAQGARQGLRCRNINRRQLSIPEAAAPPV